MPHVPVAQPESAAPSEGAGRPFESGRGYKVLTLWTESPRLTTWLARVSAGKAVEMRAGPPVQVRLPAGGWQVGFRTRPDGRTVVEVADPDGALAGLVASAAVSVLSIDAGWAGWARDPGGGKRWWALAIGHAPPAADQPAVTFIRRTGRGRLKLPPQTVDGLWLVQDELWVAAATGHYTHVRLTARSTTRIRRLQPSSR